MMRMDEEQRRHLQAVVARMEQKDRMWSVAGDTTMTAVGMQRTDKSWSVGRRSWMVVGRSCWVEDMMKWAGRPRMVGSCCWPDSLMGVVRHTNQDSVKAVRDSLHICRHHAVAVIVSDLDSDHHDKNVRLCSDHSLYLCSLYGRIHGLFSRHHLCACGRAYHL